MVATQPTIQQRTYETWIGLHDINTAHRSYLSASEDPLFRLELEHYGDVSQRSTWEKAFAVLKAKFLADAASEDGQFLIEFHLIEAPRREGWSDLALDVVRQMLMIPDAIAALAKGWRTIRTDGCDYGATPEQVNQLLKPFEEKLLGETSRHH